MTLSPPQEILARNAAQRVLLHSLGIRPATITLPLDELECLCRAAAPALDLDPDSFDLGKFHTPTLSTSIPQPLKA